MARSKSKNFFGLVLLTSLVIILAVVISATTSNNALFSDSKAFVPGPCKICNTKDKCVYSGNYPRCDSSQNECKNNTDCVFGGASGAVGGADECLVGQVKCVGDIVKDCKNGKFPKTGGTACKNCQYKDNRHTSYSCGEVLTGKECSIEGKPRCNATKTKIQNCQSGQWTPVHTCEDGTSCHDDGSTVICL